MEQKGESCLQNGYYLGLNRILPIHGKAAPLINWPASAPSLSFPVRLRSTSSVRRLDRSKAPKLTAPFVNWNAFDQSTSTKEVGNTSVLTNSDQIANILRGIDTVRWKRATCRYCTTFERLDETKASVTTLFDSIFATRSALNDCKPNRIFAKLEERNSDLNLITNV